MKLYKGFTDQIEYVAYTAIEYVPVEEWAKIQVVCKNVNMTTECFCMYWLVTGNPVTVTPQGLGVERMNLVPGTPIIVNPSVDVYVNPPAGSTPVSRPWP